MGPIVQDAVGALFSLTSDAVAVLEGEQVVAWNDAAHLLFGVPAHEAVAPGARPLGRHLPRLLGLRRGLPATRLDLPPHGTVEAVRQVIGGREVLLLRDVSIQVRREKGLRLLAELGRGLLSQPPSVQPVLQAVCAAARDLTGAAYSAVVVLREGSTTESSHFVYDAPRHLFPERMPRAVGLLAVPVATRAPARLSDIRGHPAGVGLPGVHPPLGPLVAVPLLAGDQALGVLAASNPPEGRAFDELDEQLMVDLAVHAAVALRWAEAGERERERALAQQERNDTARHDIRSPLAAGKGFTDLLRLRLSRMTPEQVQTSLQGLSDAFERIESFSARLLADSRDAAPEDEPRRQRVAVGPLLDLLVRDLRAATGSQHVLSWTAVDDAPGELWGDPGMVRQVLDNLVGNAVKHAGSAVVTVRPEGRFVRFDVRDEGPGIAEDEQARIFERWTRTADSRTRGVPGSGLGLSIVKRYVTAHGGTVGVSSRPGEGATFWVTFPRVEPDLAEAAPEAGQLARDGSA